MTQPPDPAQPDAHTADAQTPSAEGPLQADQTGRHATPDGTPTRPAPAAPPTPARGRPAGRQRQAGGQDDPPASTAVTLMKLLGGAVCLLALAYFQWTPGEWPVRLLTWVLLTLLADEFGGWFGYAGLVMGGLGYFSPVQPPAEWLVILPLVGGALMGTLLLKHSGGLFVLPFAGVLFAGVLIVVGQFGTKLDPQMTLPANPEFQRTAITAMLIALGISAARQLIGLILRARQRRTRRADTAPA
ncbi:hypothetical protein GCM10008959_04750 [Deinococcus seoulensis]|uniref:Uncharacterized protein n=1 Tax=Deinococcus seoulensis TaxID=1837379 RepID=A0ABQ2RNA9_9DEIO|nr:hypothetical protein [Deinococcus seoulensis]GGR46763.1 hypothetical protein GCM10008959_04750 [Deinococcus seoulensis]